MNWTQVWLAAVGGGLGAALAVIITMPFRARDGARKVTTALTVVFPIVGAMLAVELFSERLKAEDATGKFEREIASQPVFRIAAEEIPTEFASFRGEVIAMMERDAPAGELLDYSREWGRKALPELLLRHGGRASNASLTTMARESIDMLEALGRVDGEQCYGWLFGGAPAPSAPVRAVYADHEVKLSDTLLAVIESGRKREHELPDVPAAQADLQRVFQQIAQDQGTEVVERIARIGEREAMKADFGAACRATISLYRGVLTLEPPASGNVLRMMFSGATAS